MGHLLPREVKLQRKLAIEEKMRQGFTNVLAIAEALRDQPSFAGSKPNNIYNCVYNYFLRYKLSTRKLAGTAGNPRAVINSPLGNFIGQFQIHLPAGQIGEFSRFITALMTVARPLEAQAARVPELEVRIRELETSVRDLELGLPTAVLQEENTRLRAVIGKQETTIETLKRANGYQGGRALTPENHLAVSAGRD